MAVKHQAGPRSENGKPDNLGSTEKALSEDERAGEEGDEASSSDAPMDPADEDFLESK